MISSIMELEQVNAQVDEDVILIKKAKRDPTAFAPIYRKYMEQVYYYLLARVQGSNEAEDLTSQVFLEALEGLATYREDGNFPAWLFTIARRRAIDYHRRKKPNVHLGLAQDAQDPDQDVLTNLLTSEDLRSVKCLVADLNDEERELLSLRFAAGLTFTDIAVLLKRKESAVKMNLYRLLSRLKSQLES
jgi:RNA polymerase sigma-70 factor, ECF subfamily